MADTAEACDAVCEDEEALRPGVDALLRELGVDPAAATRFATGALPVYGTDELVLKLFPQVHAEEYPVEAAVIEALHGRLPIPTPRLLGSGERDGWGYVLMTRLPGESLDSAWGQISSPQRYRLAEELGVALAVLHGLALPQVPEWWPLDWDEFVAQQRAGCVERQRARGLADEWLAQIPAAIDVDLTSRPLVLVHTEVMREHLLVKRDAAGAWRFSGLIDFEPATAGAREYEFVGVGCFVAQGDRRFLRAVLTAYGFTDDKLDAAFRQRLMAWTLLHYYSNLPAWMERMPAPSEPTFAALADAWYGT